MLTNTWCAFHVIFVVYFLQCFTILLAKGPDLVTCGSVLKLFNVDYKVRLHSHDVKYGSGSGQQSVTGTTVSEDVNSNWAVKAVTGKNCVRGEAIKCNDVIRLNHLSTNKNLHSHLFSSPLSGYQEISCYGTNGDGDTGDHWKVICDSQFWYRSKPIKLLHLDTNMYLACSQQTYGRPINGQHEIIGVGRSDMTGTNWKPMEGIFIQNSDSNSHDGHDEL